MEKESLEKAQEILADTLKKSNINEIDKLELILNIYYFLEYRDYQQNIQTLKEIKYGQSKRIETFNIPRNKTNK